MTSLGSYAAYWGVRRAEHDAIVFEDVRLKWAEFFERTEAIAAAMQDMGVEPGDRVGILLPNGVEWPITYLAIWRIGAIVVPLNVRFGAFELRGIEGDAECRLLVTSGAIAAPLEDRFKVDPASDRLVLAPRRDEPREPMDFQAALTAGKRPRPHPASGEEIAAIFYTSGTTGLPKGTIHTHASIQAALLSLELACHFSCEDRGLMMAPLAFTGMALGSFVPLLMTGGCAVIERELVPARMAEIIEREKITYIMVVPAIWERLARLPSFPDLDLSSIRLAGTGGAPVSPDLMESYRAKGVVLQQTYGSTEGGCLVSIATRDRALEAPSSCGQPLLSLAVRVVDEAGKDVAPGEVGELMLSGTQLMKGYWRNPEATASVMQDGWYRTGDLGSVDAEGAIAILDRKKNMIISGGVNIYPAEIERAMASIPAIEEIAVIGVPDDTWGERVVAMVYLAQPATREEIYREVRALLGPMKAPKDIVILSERLPRTVTNKVARDKLPDLYRTLPKPQPASS